MIEISFGALILDRNKGLLRTLNLPEAFKLRARVILIVVSRWERGCAEDETVNRHR